MNCKQGDLALIIGPAGRSCVGKVVRCVELLPVDTRFIIPSGQVRYTSKPGWLTDTVVVENPVDGLDIYNRGVSDRFLMPLRPPADDETDTADEGVTDDRFMGVR